MKVLDAGWPTWNLTALKSLGVLGIGRYLAPLPNDKAIGFAEYEAALRVGLTVFLVWESSGVSYAGGYQSGYAEGHEARRQARVLGHPDSAAIYAAIDTGAHWSAVVMAYQRGFNDGGNCGPQGFYGDAEIGNQLLDYGLIRLFWQTNATGWPGDSVDCPRAALIQRTSHSFPNIGGYDESDVFAVDYGQNPRPAAPLPPFVPSPPTQHPTLYVGDLAVHLTLISGIHLDREGDGEVAVADVAWNHVQSIVVIGGNNPNGPKPGGGRYDKTPTTRVVNGSNPALIVIENGEPEGTYSLNVSSV